MYKIMMKFALLMTLGVIMAVLPAQAQNIERVDDDYDAVGQYEAESNSPAYYRDRARTDRYLDVEIWTDRSDGEYYAGDNIVLHFRANRDCFVAIYTIDSRGRVNLLFPSDASDDNYIQGDVHYRLPGSTDGYDLVLTGPEGIENIQVVASQERFPIPSWYHNSGLICDWDDRYDYMDYLNGRYFVKYDGQRFAYDRAVVFVNEWEDYYYRPIYTPVYPSWSVCGNVYLDYDWGSSVYINGVYWGCTPLYIPRVAIGWHTLTIYDRWGHCWEDNIHVSYYNTVILDRSIVRPGSTIKSKYKEVRQVGYRDPVKNGYPKFNTGKSVVKSTRGKTSSTVVPKTSVTKTTKYAKGATKVVKTSRGYEIDPSATKTRTATASGKTVSQKYKTGSASEYSSGSRTTSKGKATRSSDYSGRTATKSNTSSGYYQKKSGSSSRSAAKATNRSKSSSGSKTAVKQKSSSKSSSSGSKAKQKSSNKSYKPSPKKSSGSSSSGSKAVKPSSPRPSKSSGGSKSSSGASKSSSGSKSKTKR